MLPKIIEPAVTNVNMILTAEELDIEAIMMNSHTFVSHREECDG